MIEGIETISMEAVTAIRFDSRAVRKGDLFVAVRGTAVDGHDFIADAAQNGAQIVVCERLPEFQVAGVRYFKVSDTHLGLSEIAAQYYGHPSKKLRLVGVTGTNGKTTTATLLHDLFNMLGHKSGLLSTVVNKIGDRELASTHTTPDPVELNWLLSEMVAHGCEYCFMEVSSHALVQKRTHGLHFSGGVFTNLTHDHLDYHGTFAEYLKAKKSFFDELPTGAFALTNADDRNGAVMLQNCEAVHRDYSLRSMATYNCRVIEEQLDGMQLRINGSDLWVHFIGRFNAYNLAAVYGAAVELGQKSENVLRAMSMLQPVSGRFEIVKGQQGRIAVVDYAHTPDALKNVLDTIAQLQGAAGVITVVGCGGDRDREKRPVMARIAAQGSTRLILTSDNPRSEDPAAILDEMLAGLSENQRRQTLVIEDRAEAIRTAAALCAPSEVILIAGKGHETYQERMGVRTHFDDKEIICAEFK